MNPNDVKEPKVPPAPGQATPPDYSADPGQPQLPGPADEDSGEKIEIELIDDTPEADRGRTPPSQPVEKIAGDDADDDKFEGPARERMKRLRYVYHEERRAKERAERQINESVEQLRRFREENVQLRQHLAQGERVLISEAVRRAEAQVDGARVKLLQTQEGTDNAAITKAQEDFMRAVAEHQRLQAIQPVMPDPALQQPQQPQPPPQQPPGQPQQPQPSRETQEWVQRNPWFNAGPSYRKMTNLAVMISNELIEDGIAPSGPTAAQHFAEVEKRLQLNFPDFFGSDAGAATGQRTAQPVQPNGRANGARPPQSPAARPPVFAGGSRAPANGPVKVRLTQSQVDIARRLGVTPEAYAREYLKLHS